MKYTECVYIFELIYTLYQFISFEIANQYPVMLIKQCSEF